MEFLNEPSAEANKELSNPKYHAPKYAHVIFEALKNEIQDDGSMAVKTRIVTLNAENRPSGVKNKLAYYIRKGAKILGYANFPSHDHPRSDRRAKFEMFNGVNGAPNEYESLVAEIKMLARGGSIHDVIRERDALQEKLAAYQAKEKEVSEGEKNERKGRN